MVWSHDRLDDAELMHVFWQIECSRCVRCKNALRCGCPNTPMGVGWLVGEEVPKGSRNEGAMVGSGLNIRVKSGTQVGKLSKWVLRVGVGLSCVMDRHLQHEVNRPSVQVAGSSQVEQLNDGLEAVAVALHVVVKAAELVSEPLNHTGSATLIDKQIVLVDQPDLIRREILPASLADKLIDHRPCTVRSEPRRRTHRDDQIDSALRPRLQKTGDVPEWDIAHQVVLRGNGIGQHRRPD